MKFESNRTNYSIDAIERSIVMDNKIGSLPLETKQKLYDDAMAKLGKYPDLIKILDIRHLHTYPVKGVKNFARVGVLPSKLVISDERIRDMCRNPFWNNIGPYGEPEGEIRFTPCPNLAIHSSCPYYSPSAKEVRAKLDEADIFVAIQTKLFNSLDNAFQFPPLHRLRKEINSLLGAGAVIQNFGNGPCQACRQPCLGMGECRSPEIQTPALESQGVAVGQLNRDLAFFTGDKSWEIKFLKHFGLPNMTPRKWKFNIGLAIKLPGKGKK